MIKDVPTRIVQNKELTYSQKMFLLWCWCDRIGNADTRYDLFSNREYCNVRMRNVRWYSAYFGIHTEDVYRYLFNPLRKLRIIKVEFKDTRRECTYVDFLAC